MVILDKLFTFVPAHSLSQNRAPLFLADYNRRFASHPRQTFESGDNV